MFFKYCQNIGNNRIIIEFAESNWDNNVFIKITFRKRKTTIKVVYTGSLLFLRDSIASS